MGVRTVAPGRSEVLLRFLLWKLARLGLGLCGLLAVGVCAKARLPGTPRHTVLEDHVGRVEVVDRLERVAHLAEGDAVPPVDLESAREEEVDLLGDRQHGREEVERVLEVRLESAVVCGRRLPRVAAGDEVEEDDAQRPDVIEQRGVAPRGRENPALTLYYGRELKET